MLVSRLIGRVAAKHNCPIISNLEQTVKSNELFGESMQEWRKIQIKYMGDLMELQTKIRDRMQQAFSRADQQLLRVLQIVVKSHKNIITKMNHQVFEVSFPIFQEIIQNQKIIIAQEKNERKNFKQKKDELSKLREQEVKVRKSLAEQLVQQIFTHHSFNECTNREKTALKIEKLYEKSGEQVEKVSQAKGEYSQKILKSKENLTKFEAHQRSFIQQTLQVVNKTASCIGSFAQALSSQIQSFSLYLNRKSSQDFITSFVDQFQCQYESILNQSGKGYLETTIELIKNRQMDQIMEYTKKKETKQKIKNIIQSTEINPQFTDEITRQVQLVKKIVRTKQMSLLEQLKTILIKNCKFRMNFVFMLQLYRINSQFEMNQSQIQPIVVLIDLILKISHSKRDAFVIQQIIILLLTYYITIKVEESQRKVYILQFFKKHQFWTDLQLWQSMLIQSIYIEKKTAIKNILSTSCITKKNELAEAQRTLVLNQILYIVRNMLLFDFKECEVKQFVSKFVKLLKQDDKFQREVYKSIEDAIKSEQNAKQPELSILQEHQFSKIIGSSQN